MYSFSSIKCVTNINRFSIGLNIRVIFNVYSMCIRPPESNVLTFDSGGQIRNLEGKLYFFVRRNRNNIMLGSW
jgi:hypothetical protein